MDTICCLIMCLMQKVPMTRERYGAVLDEDGVSTQVASVSFKRQPISFQRHYKVRRGGDNN